MHCSNISGMATLLQQKNCMKTLTNGGVTTGPTTAGNTASTNPINTSGITSTNILGGGSGGNVSTSGSRILLPHEMATSSMQVVTSSSVVGFQQTANNSLLTSSSGIGNHPLAGSATTSLANSILLPHQQPNLQFFNSSHNHNNVHQFSSGNNYSNNSAAQNNFTNSLSSLSGGVICDVSDSDSTSNMIYLQTTTGNNFITTNSQILGTNTVINSGNQQQYFQQQQQLISSKQSPPITSSSSGLQQHQYHQQHHPGINPLPHQTHNSSGMASTNLSTNLPNTDPTVTKINAQPHQNDSHQSVTSGTNDQTMNAIKDEPHNSAAADISSAMTAGGNGDTDTTVGTVEEQEPEPEIDIVINNVVCSFSVRCHLNLRDIALNGFNVEFRRENGMVTMKLRRPYTTASIWSSGRITCTGATSEKEAKIAARRYARCLQKLGFRVRFNNFRVVNVLGTCSMPWAIKIVNFSEKYKKDASYEPELHPGVTYKLKFPKATLKIFSTGSITVTAGRVAHVQAAIEHIYPLVYEFRTKRSPEEELRRAKARAAATYGAIEIQEEDVDENMTVDEPVANDFAIHSPSAKQRRRPFGRADNDPIEDNIFVSDIEDVDADDVE